MERSYRERERERESEKVVHNAEKNKTGVKVTESGAPAAIFIGRE